MSVIVVCDETDHIGQVHKDKANKELERINKQFPNDKWVAVGCDKFRETFLDYPTNEIETSENHVWIVRENSFSVFE